MSRNARKMDLCPHGEEPGDDYLNRESDTPMTEGEQAAYAKGLRAGLVRGRWEGQAEARTAIAEVQRLRAEVERLLREWP